MTNPKRVNPAHTKKAEQAYGVQLRKIAKHVGDIINSYPPGAPQSDVAIRRIMDDYSQLLGDWAHSAAARMLYVVGRKNEQMWRDRSIQMSKALRDEIQNAPTGDLMRSMLAEQVTLIQSIPLDAAQRVHAWTMTGLEDSSRAKEAEAAILDSGNVSASKATLIARTEVARTASKLTEARATHIGSTSYIWRTSGDGDVRESHAQMNGKVVRWDTPPTLSDGTTTHAGQIYNCRCYPDPIIPE
jgi:SPP1 gp7 family putative phage head morphogenesis protein